MCMLMVSIWGWRCQLSVRKAGLAYTHSSFPVSPVSCVLTKILTPAKCFLGSAEFFCN